MTRCDNPSCRKEIPAINLEFGGPHTIVNFMEGMDWGRTYYACGPACKKAARGQFESETRYADKTPWLPSYAKSKTPRKPTRMGLLMETEES